MGPSWGRGWDREAATVCFLHVSLSVFTLQHFYCVSLKTDKLTWKRLKILPMLVRRHEGLGWLSTGAQSLTLMGLPWNHRN